MIYIFESYSFQFSVSALISRTVKIEIAEKPEWLIDNSDTLSTATRDKKSRLIAAVCNKFRNLLLVHHF